MNPILRNILAVVAGLVVGGAVNMGIVQISGSIIPPPEGADITTMEGLKASMHLFQPQHFLMPFLAHALGTFAGALLTAFIAANRKMILALVVGLFFLAGGISAVAMLPAPMWFNVVDLVGAYIPMSFFAAHLVLRRKGKTPNSE
jgi:hypothetical protein